MAVSNNFSASSLDFNGFGGLSQPTALVWGADGRLYVTEVDGDVHVLTIAFGDPDPNDGDTTAQFYVTEQVTLNHVKSIPNHNDDGTANAATKRQVTGIDVTPQFDANGAPVMIGGKPAVTVYVTSSDSRIGAGGGGADANLDTNSGVITKLTQTGPNSWDAVDIVRGLARSEENHALNGLEVIQVLDAGGKLVSERLIVANGGNANNGAPSNHFAGQQETAYSAAILEVDLTMLASMPVLTDGGRKYVYDVPTLDDPALPGAADGNDPFGGNDGFNGGKIDPAGPISIYSPGYRNAYDVEVTEDGRVYTYDNGANNLWGGRPIGEAGDNGATSDFAQAMGYIALNLNNGDGSTKDPMSLVAWDPKNYDQMHEVTRSDDLAGRVLAAGQGGAQTYTLDGLTYVYGGHPNPTRAEGSRAGLLFTPEAGVGNAFLLVSNVDSAGNGGGSDYDEVIAWLQAVEANNAAYPTSGVYGADDQELTRKVLAVTPGVLYDIYGFADGSGQVVVAGGAAPQGGTFLGKAGLPADIGEIIAAANPVEGNYLEGGFTDGALDSGKGSINGLTEYTSTVLDGGGVDMSGALIAASLNQGSLIVIGRDANGVVQTATGSSGETLAADRTVLQAGGGPLGLASIGDEFGAMGLNNAFRGSIWVATYKQNGPFIEIFQPANGAVPLAGQDITDETDADLDGLNELIDPFEFSAENGYALEVGQKIVLDFTQQNTNFPGTLSDTGFLGAALDGVTPNQDARTAAENFPAGQQQDGLYDNGGNIIPGGNAPTFQIKNAQPGSAVGSANSARDAVHTGIRPDPDVGRILATLDMANWIPSQQGGIVEGQVSGLMFGDGTQSNFLRIVMGAVGGTPYLEVGVETGDVYQRITRVDVPGLADPAVTGIELRLEIAIDAGFAVGAAYRLDGAADFVALPLNGFVLPQGVLRDVLTGAHQIAGQTSGAAIGLIAEDVAADTLTTVDFNELKIEAFGNEIVTNDPAAVGGPGTPGIDTVVYTGTAPVDATLADDVENFDGSGSSADVTLSGNAGANIITLGTGINKITTGGGADVVRGTLEAVGGSEITDFSNEDALVISGADTDTPISYEAGSAVININGQKVTFSGPDFENFVPGEGPATFDFENTADGLRITRASGETILYRVNAGSTDVAAIDGGPVWIGDLALENGNGSISVTGEVDNEFSNVLTDSEGEVDYIDPGVQSYAPWQLFVHERSDNSNNNIPLTYNFDVAVGATYKITLLYTENWPGAFNLPSSDRIFDVTVDGTAFAEFADLNPLVEAAAALGQALPPSTATNAQKQPFLGTVLTRELIYTAVDDQLNLAFIHNNQNPKINAIQISQLGGPRVADGTAPVVESVSIENLQGDTDSPREITVVLSDNKGFDAASLVTDGSELVFSGIVPTAVSAPSVVLTNGGMTATLTYVAQPPASGSWPSGEGQISIAAGVFADAAGNSAAGATSSFILEPNLDNLVRGSVVRAINVGTTDTSPATNLGPDPLEGGAVDNNRYGGAIAADSLLLDATGQPIAFEADDNAYYTSPKGQGPLNANVDGQSGTTGSNSGGIDLDGSALHTYRDSQADIWTATYGGFANGSYVVELHFAELFHSAAGGRVGDFTINGTLVGDDYDAFVAGGGADRPSVIRHNVLVTDGTITVQVDSSSGQAGYSAIVVYDAVPSDLPPTISVSAGSAVEGEDAVITVTRMGDLSEAVTVTLSLTDVSTTPADRGPLAATTVVIPAGQTSASTTVPIIDDDLEEPAESFTVSITGVSNAGNDAVIATGGGTTTVTIAASDVAPTPAIVLPIDFNANPLLSYSNQDQTPQGFQIDPDGAGITLSGNTWKKTLLPGGTFTVGADTVLRFDVTMQNGTAEFVSIGLENDNNYKTTDDLLFQVFGSINIAKFDQSVRNDYTTVGQTVSYEISLAAHAGRTFDYLALINDDDAAQSSIVRFSNVELVQGGGASGNTQPPHIVGDALPDVTATQDMPLEVSLPFEDPDTAYDQLSFSFQGLPDFLSLSGGLLVGTPGNEHVGVHTIEVTATDPEGNAAIDQFDLTVENVNDAPIVTGSIPNATAPLNQAFNMALPAGLFTDIDPNDTLTYRAEGLPAGLSIDPVTGTISGTPQQNSNYTVTVFATDTAQAETSASFVLQVDEVTLPEPILIEVENFTGLTEANSDLVNFRTEFAAPASGSTVVKVGAGQQGVISTSLGGFGVVAGTYDLEIGYFDENDGESQVNVLLQLADGTQTLIGSFTMNQVLAGQGNALQAANLTSVTLSGVQIPDGARLVLSGTSDAREHLRFDKVVFSPVPNAQPQFESAAAQEVLENTVIAGDVNAADPEGAVVSYAIVGGADMDKLSIDPDTGVLSFVSAADFEAPGDADQNNVYEVTVEASDGVAKALQNVTITVLDAEEGLAINSPASATVAENQTVVTTVVATEDGGTAPITYAIGTAGADGSLFTIDPSTGALSFIAAPDFEAPGDAGADNVYDVEVIASNGSDEVAQLMSVMVTDVDENGGMPEALLRINAWGGEVAATDGGPNWLADGNNNPNSPYVLTATGAGNNRGDTQGFGGDTTNLPSHVPQTVLGTARSANSPFSYAIPVADLIGNGDYIVNLYLAELSAANQLPGRRIFDISVEGQTDGMLDNFDPSLPSGGGDLRILSYEVKVTDGELNIGFLHDLVDGRNNPIINAIEILSNPVPALDRDAPEAALTLNNPATATDPILVEVALSDASGIDATTLGDDDLTLSVDGVEASNPGITFIGFASGVARYEIAAPQGGWTNGTQIGVALVAGAVSDRANTPNVNEATSAALDLEIGAGGTVVYRINTGGVQVAATDGGPVWTGDQPGNGSPYLRLTTLRDDADTGGKAAPGIDGVPNAIFSTARSSDGSFFYDIPVSALGGGQNYEVRLYLAEISPTGQGGNFRNFDASLEGFVPATFDNLDPGALYGAGGGVLTARVNVDDGVLNIGLVKDLKQNPIINGIEIVALSEEVENPPIPVVPTNALQAFAAQGDLDTSQSYAAGTVGAAKLGIMLGNANIEASNFGLNSFKVTNTGDKKISAIFIDVSSALYPDSVFDPDGAGGDSATKPWAVNAAGNTGAYIGGGVGGYFLPGPDPLPNTTGTGKPSNGGYKGAMVKFDPNVSGGFGKNEIVGFSGDMDPNSIAGLTKSSLDALAVDGWDVGGISGHELIGSTFTVLFDDGTTASGQLGSDGSASGSHAIATQNGAGAVAPTLTVNGVGAGGTGTYGGSQPSVIVSGTPGDTVMVTLTKGFNPVQGAGDIPALVANRLDAYAFKANNTFDNQHVVVKLNGSGIADLSHRFDYDDSPANNKADGTFPGDDVSPIGFVAAVVDPANGNAPISPITQPIYLTNQGGPVSGDPGSGQEGYFQIVNSGADGYFKIQIEDENGTGGITPGGKWTYHTAPDAAGRQANFQGNGYYLFGSNTSTAIDNNVNGADRLEYTIYVPETDLGSYKINFAVSRDGLAAGDQQNDLWLNFKPAGQAGNGDILSYMPANAHPEPHLDGFVKIYGGSNNGNWSQAFRIDGQPNYNASVTITEAGLYTVQVEGRSQGYHVDYFELYKGSDPASSAVNSAFVAGNPGNGGGSDGGSTGGDIFGTIVTPIAASSDDWEQFGGGGSKDLEFGLNGSQPQAVGMRFDGIDIPQTAIITDAYLQFTALGTSSGAANFTIGIQGSESAATFSSSAPPQSRVIVDEFTWSNVEQWTAGGTYRTPDISELIETVIGADGASNAALAFIVAGTGSRVASSFNNGDAPELVLVLDDGSTLTM